jgi:hypothetical protein
MGLEFSKFLGGDKPLIKIRCVFVNRSPGAVVGEDGTDGTEEEEEEEEVEGEGEEVEDEDDYRTLGCVQWRRKGKTRSPVVVENESTRN